MVGECAAVRGQSSLRLVITGGGDTMVTPRGECRVFTQDFPLTVTTLETGRGSLHPADHRTATMRGWEVELSPATKTETFFSLFLATRL